MSTVLEVTLEERVAELNELILNGEILTAFEEFYAEDVTMQENETDLFVGKDACRIKEEGFVNGITEFRGAEIKNVLVSDGISVVEWAFDFTHAEWGVKNYTQVSVQRWNEEGKIVNEKFYYNH